MRPASIVDSHSHVFFGSYLGTPADPDGMRLIGELDACGIRAAVVSASDNFYTADLGRQREIHQRLAEFHGRFPGRVFCMATVNPMLGREAAGEVRRCVRELGFRGVKLHPWLQSFSVMYDEVQETFRTACDLGVPILFHDGTPPYCTSMQIGHVAGRYPDLKVVLGHGGLNDLWPDALRVACSHGNVFISTCATPFLGIRVMLKELGADRLMFGADSGFGGKAQTDYQLANIRSQNLSAENMRKLLSDNAKRLFRLTGV